MCNEFGRGNMSQGSADMMAAAQNGNVGAKLYAVLQQVGQVPGMPATRDSVTPNQLSNAHTEQAGGGAPTPNKVVVMHNAPPPPLAASWSKGIQGEQDFQGGRSHEGVASFLVAAFLHHQQPVDAAMSKDDESCSDCNDTTDIYDDEDDIMDVMPDDDTNRPEMLVCLSAIPTKFLAVLNLPPLG